MNKDVELNIQNILNKFKDKIGQLEYELVLKEVVIEQLKTELEERSQDGVDLPDESNNTELATAMEQRKEKLANE